MPNGRRFIPAIAALVAIGVAAGIAGLSSDASNTANNLPGLPGFSSYQPIAGCVEAVPESVAEPQFRPDSLSLPEGSFTTRTQEDPAPGLHVITYAVPTSLDTFVDHVLEQWPSNGWELGRGEREPGEAESVFYTPSKDRYGQFRARQIYCDQNVIELTLTLGEDTKANDTKQSQP